MKKGQEIELRIEKNKYPNVGIGFYEEQEVRVKNALKGQLLECRISKKRNGKHEAKILSIIERSDMEQASFCEHFEQCGGCMFQTLNYEGQLQTKREMVKLLYDEANMPLKFNDVVPSPEIFEYRNKMEYSFGDEIKGGPLTLGMHKKGRYHDVVNVPFCHLIDQDYRTILTAILNYCKSKGYIKYNKNTNEGFLRHLVVRKSKKTKEIMIALSASTQIATENGDYFDEQDYVAFLNKLSLEGKLTSVLYAQNDGLSDMVSGPIKILSGRDYIIENLFDLSFKISLYSFFQTNTHGAERLYQIALDLIPNLEGKICFDLFSGTGTIGQIMAKRAQSVIGIERVKDAVDSANENAEINGIKNCTFLCGDVFEVLGTIDTHPDVIVVDPPRSGMGEKTVVKVASYGIPEIVYISCNPKTLMEDLMVFDKHGYIGEEITLVDMFPWTGGVESVILLKNNIIE